MNKEQFVGRIMIGNGAILCLIGIIVILTSPEFHIYFNSQIQVIAANWIFIILIIVGAFNLIWGIAKMNKS